MASNAGKSNVDRQSDFFKYSRVPNDIRQSNFSDSANLTGGPAQALYFTAAGNVQLTPTNGSAIVIPVTAGMILNLEVSKIWATNTTVTVGSVYHMI